MLTFHKGRAGREPRVYIEERMREAVALAARPEAIGRTYNVVDGAADTERYLAAVARAIGREPPKLPPDAPTLRVPGERIRRELGYAPVDRLEEFLTALAATHA